MKRTPFKPPSDRSLSRSSSPKGGSGLKTRSSSPKGGSAGQKKPSLSPWEQQREAAKRSALNALKRARRSAEKAGVSLSDWEGEFLDSVGGRIREHGRAFADPEKGAPGQALSAMQGRKLKEITAKAKGEPRRFGRRPGRAPERETDE